MIDFNDLPLKEKIYYQDDEVVIYCADCRSILPLIPDKSIDLVLTSPPYDNLRIYGGYEWDFETTAQGLVKVLSEGSVIVWVVGDSTIDGSETGNSFKQALRFKELGLRLHDTMIYQKINYIPLTHNRYEQEFEYMFVLAKNSPKVFNPIQKKNQLGGKQYNTARPRDYDGHSIRHNTNRLLTYKETSNKGNIFSYIVGAGSDKTNHPATFPKQLASDQISSWSNFDGLILDPFLGSGTTAYCAKKLGRKCIGIEIEEKYCQIAVDRLRQQVMKF